MRTGVPERPLQIEHADLTLLGNREENQDRVAIAIDDDAAFLAVVDGMGGHADGARAAEAAIRTMVAEFWTASRPLFDPDGFLHLTIGRAHEAVVALGDGLPQEIRPRATCAVCIVQGANAYWAHVGVAAHAVHDGQEYCVIVDGDGDAILVFLAIPEKAQVRVLDLQGTLRHACSHVNFGGIYNTSAHSA